MVVNGKPVAKKEIDADGKESAVSFDVDLARSSWVALRVLGSSHTNPVFVSVEGKPIRASKKSAQWCLDAVDVCWNKKVGQIREAEREAAAAAYDVAREAYRKVLTEATAD